MSEIPEDIVRKAREITHNLLPKKSRDCYEKEYEAFTEWKSSNKVLVVNEDVVLAYLADKAKVLKSSSVWSKYSMLKATLSAKDNLDIDKYQKVKAFLKRNSVGYSPKKSMVLSREHIDRFLLNAEDGIHLMTKVALIFGVFGACRREELHSLKVTDIVDNGSLLIITLPDTKTNKKRVFTVTEQDDGINTLKFFRDYAALRPSNVPHGYFFVCFRKGKCTVQRVGIHTFGKLPGVVAQFLELPNPELYTGHCFRRTSATLVADAGVDLVTLKRHGGWRSSTVAEGYVEDSVENKRKISRLILGETRVSASTTSSIITTVNERTAPKENFEDRISFAGSSFQNAQNCVININIT